MMKETMGVIEGGIQEEKEGGGETKKEMRGTEKVKEVKEILLISIEQLGEWEEGDDKTNAKRSRNTQALAMTLKALSWFEEYPERSWEDFAWESRSEKWQAYAHARSSESFSENANLASFRETDAVLNYIETLM